jgi:hypothetical protein
MSKPNFFTKLIMRESSSDDDLNSAKDGEKKETIYPNLYMIPNDNYPYLQRNFLINKLHILIQMHKKEEKSLLQQKIGWNILYSYFFQKLFLVSKDIREKNKLLNLKEVEIRIRKQLGKIRKKKENEEDEDKKEIQFDLFEKVNYNPPVSSLFSHNFIKEPGDLFLGKNEEKSQFVQIVNTFINFKKKEKKIPLIKNIKTSKKELETKKKLHDKLRRRSTIELERFNKLEPKKESRLLDDVETHIEKIILKGNDNNDLNKIIFREEIIPKGAKKVVEKFVDKYPHTNQIAIEDELNFLNNDEKVYELEMKNTKMFENNNLNSMRYLFDFHYLKEAMNKEKKGSTFAFKDQMDNVLKQIDKAIEFANNYDNNDND